MPNHSNIVDFNLPKHSKIVDHLLIQDNLVCIDTTNTAMQLIGKRNKYPEGIFNPAFCGMILWEISTDHIFNEYQTCQYHDIRSGLILQGAQAYIFTPICNDDITSYIKILLQNCKFKEDMSPNKAASSLVKYVRNESSRTIIPSIPTIQKNLQDIIGISDQSYKNDEQMYMILLYRLYLVMFMLHYRMPLQRKNVPGKRNSSSSVLSYKKKG